jgi:hypothetical protein
MAMPRGVCGLLVPAAQAVAAEPGHVHQVDVLHLGALFQQVMHQRAEGRGLKLGAGGGVDVGHARLLSGDR